ncbi:MAG: DUF3422 family protein [Rhodanobacter sp.]
MQTMDAVRGRLEKLSDHTDRAALLIRTRVDLGLQRKSSHLLRSINRRSQQHFRMQQTAEGLALVAIRLLQPRHCHVSGPSGGKFWITPEWEDRRWSGSAPDHRLCVPGHSPDQQARPQAVRQLMVRPRSEVQLVPEQTSG